MTRQRTCKKATNSDDKTYWTLKTLRYAYSDMRDQAKKYIKSYDNLKAYFDGEGAVTDLNAPAEHLGFLNDILVMERHAWNRHYAVDQGEVPTQPRPTTHFCAGPSYEWANRQKTQDG